MGFPGSSSGKESACKARDPGSTPGLGRSLEKGSATHSSILGFPWCSDGKESACNEGDLSSIPGLESSPGGRHGNPLQKSCLENSHGQTDLAAYSPWGRKESDTTFTFCINTFSSYQVIFLVSLIHLPII